MEMMSGLMKAEISFLVDWNPERLTMFLSADVFFSEHPHAASAAFVKLNFFITQDLSLFIFYNANVAI